MAKILVVEDDAGDQMLIEEILASAGYMVVLAADGAEALEKMRDEEVDVIVTDLRMPVLNGLRLIRQLRDAGDTIPIVAISGANADQLMLAQDYGANAAVSKPLDREQFLDVLERIVGDTRNDWSEAWIHPEFGSVGEQ